MTDRHSRGATAAAAIAAVFAACSSVTTQTDFDTAYEAGRYGAAAEALGGDDAGLPDDERTLYRAGLMYASPDSGVFDPDLAEAHLERLLELHPETSHRPTAELVLGLFGILRNARARELQLRDQLDRIREIDLRDTLAAPLHP